MGDDGVQGPTRAQEMPSRPNVNSLDVYLVVDISLGRLTAPQRDGCFFPSSALTWLIYCYICPFSFSSCKHGLENLFSFGRDVLRAVGRFSPLSWRVRCSAADELMWRAPHKLTNCLFRYTYEYACEIWVQQRHESVSACRPHLHPGNAALGLDSWADRRSNGLVKPNNYEPTPVCMHPHLPWLAI